MPGAGFPAIRLRTSALNSVHCGQTADNADSARLRDCPSAWAADRRAAVISCGGEQGLRGAQVEARTGSSPAAFARRAMRASNARFLASTSAAKAALLIVFLTRLLF